MDSRNRIGRREFIVTSAGALAAGLGSACGRVPRVKSRMPPPKWAACPAVLWTAPAARSPS